MASYKGIEIADKLRPYLPYMPRVEEYREMLQSLQAVWDNLSLLGQLSGTTAEMGNTRAAFANLTGDLLNNLAEQTLAKNVLEMAAKSQVVIDILVRNLFERTADIGFLATDDEIRRFAAAPGDPAQIAARFREYVRKYSVYEDVVLLGRQGEVLARLKSEPLVSESRDGWVREALSGSAAYVEAYGCSDLFPGAPPSLIYASRVQAKGGEVLGVLALCFRFSDEMSRIFTGLSQGEGHTLLALLDRENQVIASSDRWQLPLGAELALPSASMQRLRFAGRNYLAFASDTRGYQGYFGPGWRGLVLMPLDHAFEIGEGEEEAAVSADLLPSVLAGGRAFPAALQAIPRKAEGIQRNLSRSVWNGTVRHSDASATVNPAFSKILLAEISRTGMRMREVFSRSIGNLQNTVLSALLADSHFLASLAVDIMDRNLYERANDCRWWALDPSLQRLMGMPPGSPVRDGLESVLSYINGLYTVYSNLLVFDAQGQVVAVSNPAYADLIGQAIAEPWVASCLALNSAQAYTVSAFARTPLYADRPTYIYAAAIRSPDESRLLGGIGIVFDSAPQFHAMLCDVLPREADGQPVAGSFALFVDGAGCVIASSDPAYPTGSHLDLPEDLYAPKAGGTARIMAIAGQIFAVGAQGASGYREFKGKEDPYRNPVSALVFMPLGPLDAQARLSSSKVTVGQQLSAPRREGASCEIATFYLGEHWLGLPVSSVVEAIELADAARLANAPKQVYGALIYQGETLPLYNLHAALGLPEGENSAHDTRQVVVVRGQNGRLFGILVDTLGDVPEVPQADIADVSSIYVGITPVLASVVKTPLNPAGPMLTILSVASMQASLGH